MTLGKLLHFPVLPFPLPNDEGSNSRSHDRAAVRVSWFHVYEALAQRPGHSEIRVSSPHACGQEYNFVFPFGLMRQFRLSEIKLLSVCIGYQLITWFYNFLCIFVCLFGLLIFWLFVSPPIISCVIFTR